MQIADLPKLKAHQKRAMFKSRLNGILKNHGFQYHKNRFIRLHEGQILLSIGMELSRTGEMDIRFGGMPLCADRFNPELSFGERIADFGRIYPLQQDMHTLSFEEQLDIQADFFERYLLETFAEVDSIAALLDYQERILEDRLSAMPADWAAWESVYLRDYEKAMRYAAVWEALALEAVEAVNRQKEFIIMEADLNRHDRSIRLRDHRYSCKRRMHMVYEVQRFRHLLELGAYPLLQERINENIGAAEAAFCKYLSKE